MYVTHQCKLMANIDMRFLARPLLHCHQQLVNTKQRAARWAEEQTAFTIKRDHNDPIHSK